MDEQAKAYYEAIFTRDFATKQGMEFQNFFAELMEKRYPTDFLPCRPWGNRGDRKNDGYLRSRKRMFQVYAPNEMTESETVGKINEDFIEALAYWGAHVRSWVFVHNSRSGLGPAQQKTLLDLRKSHVGHEIEEWGFEALRNELFQLSDVDIAALLGPFPTRELMQRVGFPEVQEVLRHISQVLPRDYDPLPVSSEKLDFNDLGTWGRDQLRHAMMFTDVVRRYLVGHHDEEYGERVASAFRQRYAALRSMGVLPTEIYLRLQEYAAAPDHRTGDAAVVVVLAYFFERCDIFENASSPADISPAPAEPGATTSASVDPAGDTGASE